MFLKQPVPPPFLKGQSVIFFGGDVNLGRRMNWNLYEKPFGNLPIMQEADLRIINLVSVAAAQGQQGIDKGESGPYYYHARPEQINLLTEAQIDVALTANNHALDYYEAALLEQNDYLDRAGILHCGTGANLNEASQPLFIKVNKIIVALFNVDATTKQFAATDNKAGTFYLPPNQPELWKNFFAEKIADAQKKADVVLVAPHWGINGINEPLEQIKTLGRLLIDCGADAVLGCHSHFLHGVENYKNRPIIYDAGNFIFDASTGHGGGFSIVLSKQGVEEIFFVPLKIGYCKTFPAEDEFSKNFCAEFSGACRKLNCEPITLRNDLIKFKFEPPIREDKILEPVELSSSRRGGEKFIPLTEPLADWTVDKVPDDAAIEPQQFGAVKLVGCRISPECLIIKKRQMLYVETWWTLDEPTDKDYTFRILGEPVVKNAMPNFGAGMDHQPCDWMWPTNRWKSGVIYRERFGLRPPNKNDIVNIELQVQISVLDGEKELGKYFSPTKIQLQIPNLPTVKFANIIDEFKHEFKAKNGMIFFMLRNIKANASELEQSSFRRSKLFRKHLGVEVYLITSEYQNDILDQRDNYGMDAQVLNMYDYFQEIDREIEKPRKVFVEPMHEGWKIERLERDWRIYRQDDTLAMYCVFTLKNQKLNYINYFDENHKKCRRDTYDSLGFLSRRQILDTESGTPKEVIYYRPDGTIALHEVYEFIEGKTTLTLTELIDREGAVTKSFNQTDEVLEYWLMQMLQDKTRTYFLIGDRTPDWHKAYTGIKSAELENVHVLHQLHNVHVRAPFDPFISKLKPRYRYIHDSNIKSDVIITLTRRQRDDIIKRYGLKNVITLPHSLTAVPQVTDVELDPFKIVQVGRIVEEKGHAKSIEIMKKVLEQVPQATLQFYGTGSLQTELQKVIKENHLEEHIKFKGFSTNMPAVFASAAMSILPSTFEGFPLVIQESLQQGCPVVAFDCNYGPADGIENGVNGYLVPVDDIEAMADRIIKILTEPGLREKLSANCVKSVEKFSPEVVASKWAELFCQLMRRDDNLKGA